jgi:hypothetical protein
LSERRKCLETENRIRKDVGLSRAAKLTVQLRE